MAQGAELSDDRIERTRLAASRSGFSILATFLINIVGFGYIFRSTPAYPNGQMNPAAYFPFAVIFGLFITIFIFLSALGTHRKIVRLHPLALQSIQWRHNVALGSGIDCIYQPSNSGVDRCYRRRLCRHFHPPISM
jgi:Na+/melibiose symporter-like transporter